MDYTSIRDTAKDLITQFGASVKVISSSGTTFSTKAVRTTIKQEGQVTTETEAYLLHGSVSKVPAVGDIIEIGGLSFHITAVEPIKPGGTALLYRCLV